ncbi:hypothetical protein [Actinomadura montaniterrae]|uniref:Uncharacterized protein n=1 Tax=Actinomadura montaniterrae TaxID=1803903 RepID=A0A6L3VTB4_9ACTN|nr:hypothetical protein [Actinomadura montaniterrae]KAB2379301.1 hypothetical protein F9B16_21050 [Actinomadura montaniterrae]
MEVVVKAKDIEPGEMYALKPWHRPDQPLRAVRAIRADGPSLVYEGPGGEEWTGALSRVVGPWRPHAEAREAARRAVERLAKALELRWPSQRGYNAYAVEHGYTDFRIQVLCTAQQADCLAGSISAPPTTADESGSGAGTPEPPIGSN